jgi:hypothetical protein
LFLREKTFDTFKAEFCQHVISIPMNTKNMPQIVGEIGYVKQSILNDYYDGETGFITNPKCCINKKADPESFRGKTPANRQDLIMKHMTIHLTPHYLPLDRGRKGVVIKAGWPGYNRAIRCRWQGFFITSASSIFFKESPACKRNTSCFLKY